MDSKIYSAIIKSEMPKKSAKNKRASLALRVLYQSKKVQNPAYSVTAFARDTGLSQTLLSLIFSGQRTLTLDAAVQIIDRLALPPEQAITFLSKLHPFFNRWPGSLAKKPPDEVTPSGLYRSPEFVEHRVPFDLSWQEVWVLDLCSVAGFRPDIGWISKRLGVSLLDVQTAVELLIQKRFLKTLKDGRFVKSAQKINFVIEKGNPAVRKYHAEMMRRAQLSLEDQSDRAIQSRWISSMTIAGNADSIGQLRQQLLAFEESVADHLAKGASRDLIQLNIQLFPVSKGKP